MDRSQHIETLKHLEGRKKALMTGEHYTNVPLSNDHREDVGRWLYDLTVAIAALSALLSEATVSGESRARREDERNA